MSDDRFNVIVHHGGEVEAHEEVAEVEIGDSSGLNSDVEVEGGIEVDILFQIINMPHLCNDDDILFINTTIWKSYSPRY